MRPLPISTSTPGAGHRPPSGGGLLLRTALLRPRVPGVCAKQKAAIKAWQAKIDLIVDNCNDTDVSFKNSLEVNVTGRKDFSAPKYTKMDQEEAARASSYASKGRGITHTELQAFNELMYDNRNSTEFSKAFYEKLTPEKSLAFSDRSPQAPTSPVHSTSSDSKTSKHSRRTWASRWPRPPRTRTSPPSGARSSESSARSKFHWPGTTTAGRTDTSCSAASCASGNTMLSS
ncbi:hypothetical protein NKH18_19485 [Streptomyces sp. M10(2022)]